MKIPFLNKKHVAVFIFRAEEGIDSKVLRNLEKFKIDLKLLNVKIVAKFVYRVQLKIIADMTENHDKRFYKLCKNFSDSI